MKVELSKLPFSNENRSFLQSSFWASFKQEFSWKTLVFSVEYQDDTFQFLLLSRRVAKLFWIAYSPFPKFLDIDNIHQRQDFLQELSRKLQNFLPLGTLFLRWDLLWAQGMDKPFVKPKVSVQPASTTIINLTQSIDEILAHMKSKTRYNIRLAERKGIRVLRVGAEQISQWYTLYQETAKRDGIRIHTLSYYQKIFNIAEKVDGNQDVRLYMAWHEKDLLGGIIVIFYQKVATYIYGASSSLKRNMMANYALQWRAICDAKIACCNAYDLYGIPSSLDPLDPWAGLYQFKIGFGGEVLHRCGAYDYPYVKVFYPLYRFIEGIRAKGIIKMKSKVKVQEKSVIEENILE